MAQVTIYLPDELAERLRAEAKRAHKSVSAYLAELAANAVKPATWPRGFDELFGSCPDLVAPEDPPPDDVDFE